MIRTMVSRKNVSKSKAKAQPVKRVWRVTADVPQGEYVDPSVTPERTNEAPLRPDSGWHESTFDLSVGLDVSETPDTLPDDLFDKLFNK